MYRLCEDFFFHVQAIENYFPAKLTPLQFSLNNPSCFYYYYFPRKQSLLFSPPLITLKKKWHWPMWLSGWCVILYTKRWQVQFLVRAHTQVRGSVPGQDTCLTCVFSPQQGPVAGRHLSDVSLSHWCFSLPLSYSFSLSNQ